MGGRNDWGRPEWLVVGGCHRPSGFRSVVGGRVDDGAPGGGRPAVRGPHPSPPLWIPAFAGMTKWGAGMTKWGAGMTMVGAGLLSVVGGWMGGCLTPHRPSGFRPSPE